MAARQGVLQSIGLWWERLHIFGDDTVQHAGVVSRWKRDLLPVGDTEVQPGELVELHVTIPPDLALPQPGPPLRFDILEFDWLFWNGADDPLQSLRTPGAADPSGDFTVLERTLVERPYSATETTVEAVVGGYRVSRPADFDTAVLVVRDTRTGWKDIVAWWRVPIVDDREPRAYFVAELPGPDAEHVVRDATSVQLRVARTATPGASVRLTGTIADSVVDPGENAQPVPRATVTLGGRKTTSGADGRYVVEARLALGDTPLTVARPGIDTRTFTVRLTARADGATDVVVLTDAGAQAVTATIAAGADPALARLQLDVTALVHRISGTVVWPDSRIIPPPPAAPNPPLTLADRFVCALKVDGARVTDRLPRTSREWDRLRQRPDVLRSARPGRPARREATGGDGRFELSFVDLQVGAQYLLWVESTDPADRSRTVPEAVVRTLRIPDMRRAGLAQNGNGVVFSPHHDNRRVVVSAPLNAGGAGNVIDTLRVVAAAGGAPGLRVVRPRPANLTGIDQTPPVDTDDTAVSAATRRATGLEITVLPLVPVFEPVEDRSPLAHSTAERFQALLETTNPRAGAPPPVPRGVLAAGVRWLLDAERGPTVTAAGAAGAWRNAAACQALEHTLLVSPRLADRDWTDANWLWWRADAVSAADFAQVDLGAGATFGGRSLRWELVPVLTGAIPRLLGLFARRTINLSPGHGLYTELPAANRNAQNTIFRTKRPEWVGYTQPPANGQGQYVDDNTMENWAGEDENAAGLAVRVHAVIKANGADVTSAREVDQSLPGRQMVVDGAGNATFAPVNPAAFPDFPRLWQQNAYYGIGAGYDATVPLADRVVDGLPFTSAAANNYVPGVDFAPKTLSLDGHGLWAKIEMFRKLSGRAAAPLDLFIAIHTNAAGPGARGYFSMYLDVRPGAGPPAPGTAGYVEANTASLGFARSLGTELTAASGIPTNGAPTRSYWVNGGGIVLELAYTTNHFRAGNAVQAVRSRVAAAGLTAAPLTPMPRPGGRDVPVGYVEFGFHTSTDDAALLGQVWFRSAAAVGFARACEINLRGRPDPVSGPDVVALLQSMFGNVPAVAALAAGPNPLAAAPSVVQIVDAVERVTGHRPALAGAGLGAVVTAIEDARDLTTRRQLVARIATALTPKAGYDVADLDVDVDHPLPAPVDDAQRDRRRAVADAVLQPLLVALGATIPDGVAPVIAHLPRPARPPTRADAAAVLAAGLGIRPGNLASVTAPVNGSTVLATAGAPEVPDAYVPARAIDTAVTAIGAVRPVDVYRLAGVRVPATLIAGDHALLTIETAGTAWRVQPADIAFTLSRAGTRDITLTCAIRRTDTLITELWPIPATPGTAEFSLTARISHPSEGTQTLGPVRFTATIGPRP